MKFQDVVKIFTAARYESVAFSCKLVLNDLVKLSVCDENGAYCNFCLNIKVCTRPLKIRAKLLSATL